VKSDDAGTMKAVRAHRRGGPEELTYEVAPRPSAGPGEVLVAVRSASITPQELSWPATWTDSVAPGGADRTPIIPSHEVSGVVVALGSGVADPTVGEDVFGLIPFVRDGAAAEYVSIPAGCLARKPGTVDHDAAAALPMPALTAWQALHERAGLGDPVQGLLVVPLLGVDVLLAVLRHGGSLILSVVPGAEVAPRDLGGPS